jgi:hypothetical protein
MSGWLLNPKSTKMNQGERVNLIEANSRLKKEKQELEKKMDDLLKTIDEKMSLMVTALENLKVEGINVKTQITEGEQIVEHKSDVRPFIPTLAIQDLKMNVADIKKKIRKTNIHDAARKLTDLQNENDKTATGT